MAKALVETFDRITNRRRGLKGDSSQHLREIANADRIDNTSRATAVCGMQGRKLLHLDGAWMMMGGGVRGLRVLEKKSGQRWRI